MSYIGYSKKVEFRWAQYRKIKPGRAYKRKIERAISKYGIDNFEFSILYQSLHRDHTLDEMEQHFIDEFDTIANGYNMRVGGQWAHTDYQTAEEVKAKISDTLKQTYKNRPELKDAIRLTHTGRKEHPSVTKRRIAAAMASDRYIEGRKSSGKKRAELWRNPTESLLNGIQKTRLANTGRQLSEDHRAKISANNKSSVVWILGWDGEYHFVKDNVNDFVNRNMPFKHPVIYTSLKKHDDYDDKSKLVWGVKGRGPSAGFEVIRIPEAMLDMGDKLIQHLIEKTGIPINVSLT